VRDALRVNVITRQPDNACCALPLAAIRCERHRGEQSCSDYENGEKAQHQLLK
jgi:hypothetical protein